MKQAPLYEHRIELLHGFSSDSLNILPHLHPSSELIYLESGLLTLQISRTEYEFRAGDFAIVLPNVIHAFRTQSKKEETKIDLLICGQGSEYGFPQKLMSATIQQPILPLTDLHPDVGYVFQALLKEIPNPLDPKIVKAYLRLLWLRLLPDLEIIPSPDTPVNDLASSLALYISEHFQEPLSLELLSKKFGVCKGYLSRIFTNVLHIRFNEYINGLRIEEAKKLLLEDGQNGILEIALLCGFQSQQTFNRVFQSSCGMSPREYRRRALSIKTIS